MNFTPDKNINIEINPSYITKENFRLSIDERIPKLIFKDDKYKKFSYQEIKYDEKELKRRFKGQSYISIPFIILTDNNGVVSLKTTSDEINSDGVVKVSKREIRTHYQYLRVASKDAVLDCAKENIEETISYYSAILNGNIFDICIRYKNYEPIRLSHIVANQDDFIKKVLTDLPIIDEELDELILQLNKNTDFIHLFNRKILS